MRDKCFQLPPQPETVVEEGIIFSGRIPFWQENIQIPVHFDFPTYWALGKLYIGDFRWRGTLNLSHPLFSKVKELWNCIMEALDIECFMTMKNDGCITQNTALTPVVYI